MFTYKVKIDPRIQKIDLDDVIQKSLIQSAYLISTRAKELAPYRSWNLRRSIMPDLTEVSNRRVFVWSNAKYARIQELGGTIKPKNGKYLMWKDKWWFHRAKQVEIKWKFYFLNAMKQTSEKVYNTFLNNMKNEL